VKLEFHDAIGSPPIFKTSAISDIRTTKPNDCKNLTFDAVISFLLDDRIFLIAVVPLAKIMSPVSPARLEQASHVVVSLYRCRLRMQSNDDLLFAKIKQSFILVHNANRQICNAPYDDRKVNDLCRSFRYLISW